MPLHLRGVVQQGELQRRDASVARKQLRSAVYWDYACRNQARIFACDHERRSSRTASSSVSARRCKSCRPNENSASPGDLNRVFFTTDSAVLDPRGAGVVDQLAAWMRQYPSTTLRIEGHADERGTRDYNIALGDQRATAIRNRLLQLGIASERLSTVSYGKERPVASGSTPTVWAQNRRAVFVVL